MPGIPVDAADAVALSRVLQESILRARHGDGAALLEPIPWTIGRPVDPLRSMQLLLDGPRAARQSELSCDLSVAIPHCPIPAANDYTRMAGLLSALRYTCGPDVLSS